MKNIFLKTSIFSLGCLVALTGCKADLSYEDSVIEPPLVSQFTPDSGPRYTEITVRGEYLNRVTSAFIGTAEVEIKVKVSDKELVLIADGEQSGPIKLIATYETKQFETTTENQFTYRYVAPDISENQLPKSIDVGMGTLIMGSNMLAVEEVYIVDASNPSSAGVQAPIQRKTNDEVLVTVPYVDFAQALFYTTYYDGSSYVKSSPTAGSSQVVIKRPVVSGYSSPRVSESETFEITGENLDRVNLVTIADVEIPIVQKTSSFLKLTIPLDAYPDGENSDLEVVLDYFDSAQQLTGLSPITVFVPEIYYGSDYITGRGKIAHPAFNGGEWFRGFFQFKAGKNFGNAQWGTVVDPVGYSLQSTEGGNSTAGTTITDENVINKSLVSRDAYYSVEPYVYIYLTSSMPAFFGPASKTNYFRNYWLQESKGENILGETSSNNACAGTPVLMFLPLYPYSTDGKAVAARADIDAAVNAVRNGTLSKIDASNFPVDISGGTVGGIPLTLNSGSSALKSNLTSDKWTTGIVSGNINHNLQATDQDGVVMVIHYDYENGYNPSNPAAGIYKIGFIHVTGIEFVINSSDGDARGSVVWMDTYWQKHAY